MLKKRFIKIALVLACILTLLMPYTTVLAASLTHEDKTAELQISIIHEGGEEASGTLTDEQKEFYDESQYAYNVGETRVYKIIEKGKITYNEKILTNQISYFRIDIFKSQEILKKNK